jgi:hypothetical protein
MVKSSKLLLGNLKSYDYILYGISIIIIIIICLILWKYKFKNIENFESNPQNLLQGHRFVVSLTTSPTRIKKMDEIIQNIMEQTVKPNKIHLNVPHFFKRNGEQYDQTIIDDLVKKYPLLQINRCEDKGPVSKIYPTLEHEKNDETIIIIIDDDMKYENKLFEKLISQFLKDTSTILANDVDKYVSVEGIKTPGAYAGIIFKRSMFGDDFIKFIDETGTYKNCYNSDDLILGIYFKKKNINVKQAEILGEHHSLDFSEGDDALKKQDNMYHDKRYQMCKKFVDTMLE